MYKKILSLTIFFFALFISPTILAAQDTQVAVWNCLSAKRNGIDKVMLSNSELTKNGTVYVVDCVGTPEGSYCTTGNKTNDEKLKIGYADTDVVFKIDNEAVLSQKNTTTVTATVDFAKTPLHTFYYVYFENISSAKTIKYDSINFVNNSCDNTILINPDRRFFDISTLEPLEGIRVTLIDGNGTGVVTPQMTGKDGGFYYLSENNSLQYKIEAPTNYAYANQVDQNSLKQYRANIETYSPNIYTRDDVALIPRGSQAINPPTEAFYTVDRFDKFTRVQGRVSHAFATVVFAQGDVELKRVKSDRFGNFEARLENTKIDTEKGLQLSYVKANFFDTNVGRVQGIAINTGVEIVPISNKIFGYTYDSAGNIIPEGNIEVKLKASDKVYYSTKSDKTGYFILNADKLPKFEYYLHIYASEDSVTKYHYADRDVQLKLVKNLSDKAYQDFSLALEKDLKDKTTYTSGNSIFDNVNPIKIAEKNEAFNYQKSVASFFMGSINNGPKTSQIFGKDLNAISKQDFMGMVVSDMETQLGVNDPEFASSFALYYADIAYSAEYAGLAKTNKDAFDRKIVEKVALDIFSNKRDLSYLQKYEKNGFLAYAATVAAPVKKFSAQYYQDKMTTAVSKAMITSMKSNKGFGNALATQAKGVAKSIIGDYIGAKITKDPIAGGLLSSVVGALIDGKDVGKALVNSAKSIALSEGQKLLTKTLTNSVLNKETGKMIDRGISGDIAGPIAGFLFSAISTGNVGQAAKSAVMQIVQNQVQKVVTSFLTKAFSGLGGLANIFAGPIGGIIVGFLMDMLMKWLSGSSGGGGGGC